MKRKEQMPDGSIDAEKAVEGRGPVGHEPGSVEKSLSLGDDFDSESEGPQEVDEKSRGPRRMILQLGLLVLCLVVAAAGLHFIKSGLSGSSSPVKIQIASAATIKRPLPQPDYRAMLDFLIIYNVQGRQMVTSLRMEAVFHNLFTYRHFQRKTVVFRDAVYNFLLRQDAADNTEKSWHAVFQKNLLEYLRIKLPESCPDTIRLTQVENL